MTKPTIARPAPEHRRGVRDGLRAALLILQQEEAKLADRLGSGASARTRRDQQVRHKALQVAQTRIRTTLHAHDRAEERRGEDTTTSMRAELARIGL